MPIVLLVLLCAISGLPISAGAHPPPILSTTQEEAFVEEIVAWRKEFAVVADRKDAKKLHDLYAPSFVHTRTSGEQVGRDARIKALLKGDPVIELAPADDLKIRVPGGWTAIATGTSPLKSPDEEGKAYRFAWTAVYVRAGGGWQLAASHEVRLGEVER